MLKLINIWNLLRIHLIISVVLGVIIYNTSSSYPLWRVITISSLISTIFIYAISINYIARKIWWLCRLFNDGLFPDLNGDWEGKIYYYKNEVLDGSINVRAEIRQSLTRTEIDMYGNNMISATLDVSLAKVLGLNKIYYSYLSEPPNQAWERFIGTSILNVSLVNNEYVLRGQYYTEKGGTGTIILNKTKKYGCLARSFNYIKNLL